MDVKAIFKTTNDSTGANKIMDYLAWSYTNYDSLVRAPGDVINVGADGDAGYLRDLIPYLHNHTEKQHFNKDVVIEARKIVTSIFEQVLPILGRDEVEKSGQYDLDAGGMKNNVRIALDGLGYKHMYPHKPHAFEMNDNGREMLLAQDITDKVLESSKRSSWKNILASLAPGTRTHRGKITVDNLDQVKDLKYFEVLEALMIIAAPSVSTNMKNELGKGRAKVFPHQCLEHKSRTSIAMLFVLLFTVDDLFKEVRDSGQNWWVDYSSVKSMKDTDTKLIEEFRIKLNTDIANGNDFTKTRQYLTSNIDTIGISTSPNFKNIVAILEEEKYSHINFDELYNTLYGTQPIVVEEDGEGKKSNATTEKAAGGGRRTKKRKSKSKSKRKSKGKGKRKSKGKSKRRKSGKKRRRTKKH